MSGQQVQVKAKPGKRESAQPDAPTVSKDKRVTQWFRSE